MSLNAVLSEREKTHGPFSMNALISQKLKCCLRQGCAYSDLDTTQREALEMVCHKLGRIVCGDPNFQDHWLDAAGYLTRIVEEIERRS